MLTRPSPLADCRLCPRDCRVDRTRSATGAFCRLGPEAWVYKSLLSLGEEAVLRPTWLVDLGGCSLRCVFCSEWDHIVDPSSHGAIPLDATWLRRELAGMRARGATSVSAVGGEPTVSAVGWLDAWQQIPLQERLPLVWNSNGLLTEQSRALLEPEVACWVLDAKTYEPTCTQQLLGGFATDYLTLLAQSLEMAARQSQSSALPPLIVRHLLMPDHLHCCTEPLLRWLAPRLGRWPLNLMTTFVPAGPALLPQSRRAELRQWNQRADEQAALALARSLFPVVWHNGAPPLG